MIPLEQGDINWSVVVGFIALVISIVGWFVVHSLLKRRDQIQKSDSLRRAISNCELTAEKWIKSIWDGGKEPTNCWFIVGFGPVDLYAAELEKMRTTSHSEIEAVFREVRHFLDTQSRTSLDDELRKYKECKIEGKEEHNSATGETLTSHVECKGQLVEHLKRLTSLFQSAKVNSALGFKS